VENKEWHLAKMIVQKNPGETIQNKKWHLTKNGI
jgi:hypothetical protein